MIQIQLDFDRKQHQTFYLATKHSLFHLVKE